VVLVTEVVKEEYLVKIKIIKNANN